MSFESKEAYIVRTVQEQAISVRMAVEQYLIDATKSGARICNDGYPDCRFKGTFGSKHKLARKYISRIRGAYEYGVRSSSIEQEAKKAVCSDVALGIIAELKQMFAGNK